MIARTVANAPPRPHRSPMRLLACIRFDEVCVLQGAPLIGAMFAIGALSLDRALALALFMGGSLSLLAHVFVLNDWSGIHGDLQDPVRAGRTFVSKGASRGDAGWLALALLVVSLCIFRLVGIGTLMVALMIAAASALYSAPVFHMKGRPILCSLLHLVGGVLHFLLGYSAFAAIDSRGAVIGCFFGLVFTAGHLSHEARGYEGDLLNGIRTNAVVFGKMRCFIASLALFTAAYVLLAAIALLGIVPRVLFLAAMLCPVHLGMSLRALRAGLTLESLRRMQTCYRLLYAAIGALMIVIAA